MGLRLRVSDEFAYAYRRPGQYVTLQFADLPPRFYVIAKKIGRDCFEFLLSARGEFGQYLQELAVGDRVALSSPEGRGFLVGEAAGGKALLFSTGSGIATVRPLIEAWLGSARRPEEIYLYYGEARAEDFAYGSLLADWEAEGVRVYRAVESGGEGEFRYVQDAFAAHHPPLGDAYIYLSGAPVMIRSVAETVLRMGAMPERLKVNL